MKLKKKQRSQFPRLDCENSRIQKQAANGFFVEVKCEDCALNSKHGRALHEMSKPSRWRG